MQNITKGHLRVLTYSYIYNFPALASEENNETSGVKSELRVASNVFWIRLCAMGDLGFAEAYMYGDVECDDLPSVFQVSS
jgi:cyclopropane-fatty-acyl-phospholipid synthase